MSGSVPSFCSSAFLVRPRDETGTPKHYQRALRVEFTTRCWQLYLAKAGPASGKPSVGQQALRSAADGMGFRRRMAAASAGRPNRGREPTRDVLESSGQGAAYRTIAASRAEAGARPSRRRRFEFTAIWRAAVAQSAALQCTLSRRRSLSRANDADRSCRLPLSPCQTNPTKSDLTPAFL
jgi:hypothetical protein